MTETSQSLLDRVQTSREAASWQELVDLYTPLIRGSFRSAGLPDADLADLVQDVLGVVVRELPHFHHNQRPGAFRTWLRAIAVNRLRTYWKAAPARTMLSGDQRGEDLLDRLEDPASDLARTWDREHNEHVTVWLLERVRPEFAAATWEAFRRQVIDSEKAAAVAAVLGLSTNAVLIAKSRVLKRLRQEGRGLID